MEEEIKVYTKEEADELVKQLQEVFSVVRILKGNQVGGLSSLNKDGEPLCHCFDFWGKKKACVNCISGRTLTDHKDRTKIEMVDEDIYQVFVKYINVEGQDCVLEVLKNITNLNIDRADLNKFAEKFLTSDAEIYKDALTGCLNRRFYEERKDELFDNTGVAIIDMDNLKDVNDIYGHAIGDTSLKAITNVLISNVRSDDSVIRYGGDEFILVLPNISKPIFSAKLEKILKQINEIVIPDNNSIKLSVSIGAVIAEGTPLEEATSKADKLMYEAKTRKNTLVTEWKKFDEASEKIYNAKKLYIMIVDDSDINRFLLKSILEKKYKVLEATDGLEAVKIIDEYRQNISLILLDIEMPNMSGLEYLNYLKQNNYLNDIPVIMISSDNNEDVILRAYELGAIDYITRPYNAQIVEQRVSNITKLFLRQRKFKAEIRQQINKNEAENKMISVIYSYAIEYRNKETGVHVLHVEQVTDILMNGLNVLLTENKYSDEDIKNIVEASGMHDIGKIGVRRDVLNKSTPLTPEEFEEYKKHTIIGYQILSSMTFYKDEPLVKYAMNICRWHHERYDGSGFPDGIKGDEIPLEAQVVSLANEYDSLLNKYKDLENPFDKVIDTLNNEEKDKFNPLLLTCLNNSKEVIKNLYINSQTFAGGGYSR